MAVKINRGQIKKVAEVLKKMPGDGNGLNFYSHIEGNMEIYDSEKFPPLYHPQAINFFFFVVMHDYGFWYGDDKGYHSPLYGTINGKKFKGSDFLWAVCRKVFYNNEAFFTPKYLQKITPWELAMIFSDHNSRIIWPDFEARFKMTRAFGKWFIGEKTTPYQLVASANARKKSLLYFLDLLSHIPGYDRDYLKKKNMLLAMVLANRPEKFLQVNDPESWEPIIDYHLMRLCLRLGIIEINNGFSNLEVLGQIRNREWASIYAEREIRCATYRVVQEVIRQSDRPMSFVDEKMWNARNYCPEMETPDCSKCVFDAVCAKRVDLFQPVLRTANY